MLTQVTSSSSASVSTKSQVVANNGASNGTLIYTVPAGRVFNGSLVGGPGGSAYAYINDVTIYCSGSGTTPATTAIPLTLTAGTKVKAGGQSGMLIGVESDA